MIDHDKGGSLHALRRDLHYAQQGAIGKPPLADQTEQAWCLTVLTNAGPASQGPGRGR
jgi:hypothetical protein